MYLVMLSFITNPMLTAASLICVTAYSFAHTNHPSINTLSVYALYYLVLLKIIPFGVVFIFPFTFCSTVLNNAVDSASSCLKPLSMPNASVIWT
jgi:hypothetical protein